LIGEEVDHASESRCHAHNLATHSQRRKRWAPNSEGACIL
jgi:hypothetical protein